MSTGIHLSITMFGQVFVFNAFVAPEETEEEPAPPENDEHVPETEADDEYELDLSSETRVGTDEVPRPMGFAAPLIVRDPQNHDGTSAF